MMLPALKIHPLWHIPFLFSRETTMGDFELILWKVQLYLFLIFKILLKAWQALEEDKRCYGLSCSKYPDYSQSCLIPLHLGIIP